MTDNNREENREANRDREEPSTDQLSTNFEPVLDYLEFRDAQPESAFPAAGDRIDDFVLEAEIGRGGSAVVYRATQRSLGRTVALKLMAIQPRADSASEVSRFTRETEALAALNHPSIVDVYSAGTTPGYRYIAMRYVDGPSLAQLIAGEGPAELARPGTPGWIELAKRLVRQVADALSAAHAHGMIHRDVKPQNIMVTSDGQAVLVDFGLARFDDKEITWTDGFVGTPSFASPEQTLGDALTPASDVFSLGATAFAAITGKQPFGGTSRKIVAHQIQNVQVKWPAQIAADLRAVIDHCLEKLPGDRYDNASEVRDEFDRLANFEAVLAKPVGTLGKISRYARRKPKNLALFAAVAVLAMGLMLAVFLATRRGSELQEMEARREIEAAKTHIRAGRLDEARERLRTLAEHESHGALAAGYYADLLAHDGDFAEAKRHYTLAAERGLSARADWIGARLDANGRADRSDASSWPGAETARDHSADARQAEKAGRTDDAVDALDRAVALEPNHYVWRHQRAMLRVRLLQRSSAIDDLQILRMQQPYDIEVLSTLARQLSFDRAKEAVKLMRAALRVLPDAPELKLRLGQALRDTKGNEAETILAELYRTHPDNTQYASAYVDALVDGEQYDKARSIFRALRGRVPMDFMLHRIGATVLSQPGKKDFEALAKHAAELSKVGLLEFRANGHYYQAQIHRERREYDEYANQLKQASEIDPEQLYYRSEFAGALIYLGRIDEARSVLDELLAAKPASRNFRAMSGIVEQQAGRYWNAIQELSFANTLLPVAATYAVIAEIWSEKLGQPEIGMQSAKRALEIAPKNIRVLISLAWCQVHVKRFDEACATFRQALALHPVPRLHSDYAEALGKSGDEAGAIAEYEIARKDDPKLATPYCGEALLRLDSKDEKLRDPQLALRLMKRAVELEPEDEEYKQYLARAEAAARASRRR